MAVFSFRMSIGSDIVAADATNFEDLLSEDSGAPHILPDQRAPRYGSVRKVALDGTIHRSGKRNLTLFWDYMSQEDFNTLLDTYWPNHETTQQVCIWTLNERGEYDAYNAIAERPEAQEHYAIWTGGGIRELNLRLWDLTPAKLSYDDSYDNSFG